MKFLTELHVLSPNIYSKTGPHNRKYMTVVMIIANGMCLSIIVRPFLLSTIYISITCIDQLQEIHQHNLLQIYKSI